MTPLNVIPSRVNETNNEILKVISMFVSLWMLCKWIKHFIMMNALTNNLAVQRNATILQQWIGSVFFWLSSTILCTIIHSEMFSGAWYLQQKRIELFDDFYFSFWRKRGKSLRYINVMIYKSFHIYSSYLIENSMSVQDFGHLLIIGIRSIFHESINNTILVTVCKLNQTTMQSNQIEKPAITFFAFGKFRCNSHVKFFFVIEKTEFNFMQSRSSRMLI